MTRFVLYYEEGQEDFQCIGKMWMPQSKFLNSLSEIEAEKQTIMKEKTPVRNMHVYLLTEIE